jgi:oxalate decarboxylase
MDFNANDVAFIPFVAPHYVENTGDTDLVYLEMFATPEFQDVSLNNWIRHLPSHMVSEHLNLDEATLKKIPAEKLAIL